VSPSVNLLTQLGHSAAALKRECCQRVIAANSSSRSKKSASRSLERIESKPEDSKSTLPKLSNQKHSATPIAVSESKSLKE